VWIITIIIIAPFRILSEDDWRALGYLYKASHAAIADDGGLFTYTGVNEQSEN